MFENCSRQSPQLVQDVFDDYINKVHADIDELMKRYMPKGNLGDIFTAPMLVPVFLLPEVFIMVLCFGLS
jgi:hypothetical protein